MKQQIRNPPTAQSNKKQKDSDLSISTNDDDIETVLPIPKRRRRLQQVLLNQLQVIHEN